MRYEQLDITVYKPATWPPTEPRAVLSTAFDSGSKILSGTRFTNTRNGGCGTGKIKCSRTLADGHAILVGDLVKAQLKTDAGRETIYGGMVLDITEDWDSGVMTVQTVGLYGMFATVPVVFYRESCAVDVLVDDLYDDHIVGNTWCRTTKTISVSSPATIGDMEYEFKSADAAIKQIADFQGGIEYGVDADGKFYFRDESSDVVNVFQVGLNATDVKKTQKGRKLINALFVRCNHVLSSGALVKYRSDATSIASYRRRTKVVTSPEFKDWQDIDVWADNMLLKTASPVVSVSFDTFDPTPLWPRGEVRLNDVKGAPLCEMPLLEVTYGISKSDLSVKYKLGYEDAENEIGDEIESLRREIVALESQEISNERIAHTGFEEFKQWMQQDALSRGLYNFMATEFEEEGV